MGIRSDRIHAVGDLGGAAAGRVVEAAGLAVCPGLIDTHTHSDLASFLGAEHAGVAAASVRQGVTTEVSGNCGFSPFPVTPGHRAEAESRVAVLFGPAELTWHDLASYRERVRAAGLHANLAPLVGHGSVRAGVMGVEDRPPTGEEMRAMVRLLDEAFEQGAFGLSSGLIYSPGMYARTEELVELCRAVARFGRPYATHMRGESDMVADSVREAIHIGRHGGMPLHVSHHKVAGRANWGRTEETLGMIERARRDGQDVTLDVYPYTAGSTLLFAMLPPWAQAGGVDAMLESLRDRSVRERIVHDLQAGRPGWQNLVQSAGWDSIVISSCPGAPETEGRPLTELADAAGSSPADYVFDLLLEQRGRVTMILHMMDEADVRRVLTYEGSMIGSDGIPLPGKPHPRWAGTFSRVLGHYCRQEGLLDLATWIRKATAMAADRFGLRDRGRVEPGMAADLVVFDPETVIDRATYDQPLLPPQGVAEVLVNGRAAVAGGLPTGEKAGRVLSPG